MLQNYEPHVSMFLESGKQIYFLEIPATEAFIQASRDCQISLGITKA